MIQNILPILIKKIHTTSRKVLLLWTISFVILIMLIALLFTLPGNTKNLNALYAIPADAAFVAEIKKPFDTWNDISGNSLVWQNLLSFEVFASINRSIVQIDSLIKSDKIIFKSVSEHPIYITAHRNKKQSVSFLFIIPFAHDIKKSEIERLITKNNKAAISEEIYKSYRIQTYSNKNSGKLSYTTADNLFIISADNLLVKKSIDQIKSGSSILSEKSFTRVYETSGKNVNANIYVNFKKLTNIFELLVAEPFRKNFAVLTNFAQWSSLDLNLKKDFLMINGYSLTEQDSKDFLSTFSGQSVAKPEIQSVFPSNTIFFVNYNFSDFGKWYKNYQQYLIKNKLYDNRKKNIATLNKTRGTDLEKKLLPVIGNEMALVISAPDKKDSNVNYFAVFKTSHIDKAIALLNPTKNITPETKTTKQKKVSPKKTKSKKKKKTEKAPITEKLNKKDNRIFEYDAPGALEALFGELFSNVSGKYFSFVGEYLVFANTEKSLESLLNDQLENNTLLHNNAYELFSKNISNESNIFIYSNIALSFQHLKKYIAGNISNVSTEKPFLLKPFEYLAYQIKPDGDLFYNNIFLQVTSATATANTIWETKLDTLIYLSPQTVSAADGKTLSIAAFDLSNNLYLINHQGIIAHKIKLPEKPLGIIQEIDLNKKNTKHYIFNTASYLHIIDSDGKYAEGYPLKLESNSTAPLTLTDFNDNKDYSIIVPCGKKIYNYTKDGKLNPKWNIVNTVNDVSKEITPIKFMETNCYVITDKGGLITITDSKGKEKVKPTTALRVSTNTNSYCEKVTSRKGRTFITTDYSGKIILMDEKGITESVPIESFSATHSFLYEDFNNDNENDYIFLDNNKLIVYDSKKMCIATFSFSVNVENDLLFIKNVNKKEIFGAYSVSGNKIFVLNSDGSLKTGFPKAGSTRFIIESLNRNKVYNLIVGSGRYLYNYAFD